jgi:hypothetical protein
MCYMHDQPGWQATVLRLVDVFVDGLCVRTKVNGRATAVSRRGELTESVTETPPQRGLRKRRE